MVKKGTKSSVEQALETVANEEANAEPKLEHGTKSAAIDRALAKYPGEKAKQIARHIKEDDGLDVAVSNIYQRMNKGEGKSAKSSVSAEPTFDEVFGFVTKANEAGGVASVLETLSAANAKFAEAKAMLEPFNALLESVGGVERALKVCEKANLYMQAFGGKNQAQAA